MKSLHRLNLSAKNHRWNFCFNAGIMRTNEREMMEQISGANLLAIRSQAAMASDYTTLCRNNANRLTLAYLALQVENVRLLDLARDAYECWDNDRDAKVGKLLRAMLDEKFRAQYRPDLTHNAVMSRPEGVQVHEPVGQKQRTEGEK